MITLETAKPRFRGVSHQAAFFIAAVAGALLLAAAPTPKALLAGGIYVVTLMALFGVSALYHRIQWGVTARTLMKRLDHATIFLFIAGCYTPICLLAFHDDTGLRILWWAWLGAALGVGRAVLWPHAPKLLAAVLYLLMGWLVVAYMPAVHAAVGTVGVAILASGGVLYSLGALVYAFKRPDPLPLVFGYHEVFHALVIAACVCHFALIARIVLAA